MYKTLINSIRDSLRLYLNNFVMLASIALPFLVLIELFEAYYIATYLTTPFMLDDLTPLLISNLTIKPFYNIAIIFYISSVISSQSLSITQVWLMSVKFWPIYFLLYVFTNILIGTGLMFYVIPGLFLFIRFSFADFHLLLDKQSPITSIKSSYTNTRKHFLLLSAGFLIFGVVIFYFSSLLNTMFDITEPEINFELISEVFQKQSSSESQAVLDGKLLIKFPDFSLLKAIFSIIYNLALIIFTIFAFRVYHMAKEQAEIQVA